MLQPVSVYIRISEILACFGRQRSPNGAEFKSRVSDQVGWWCSHFGEAPSEPDLIKRLNFLCTPRRMRRCASGKLIGHFSDSASGLPVQDLSVGEHEQFFYSNQYFGLQVAVCSTE